MSGATRFRRNMFHVFCRPSSISGRVSSGRISERNQMKVCLSFVETLYKSHAAVFSHIRVMSSCIFLFSKKSQAPQVFNENVFMSFAAPFVSAADNSQTDFEAETVCRLFTDFDCRNSDNLLISHMSTTDY